ncbi:MAG: hypothetical protein WBA23_23915 [Tunicatimonas sp.]|uniref:hypothetical protein n=1 Tax=Tunicatimonas sp. TaxID=1940096 RepID=UPI003C781ED4
MSDREKLWFFARNLARGFFALFIVVGGFILLKDRVGLNYFKWLAPVYEQPILVYLIYSASELLFGIIPPEIFMIWALRLEVLTSYLLNIGAFAVISYLAGVLGYLIGNYLNHTRYYAYFRRRVFGRYEHYFQRFGAFLIIVAALTPLPFFWSKYVNWVG